MDPKKPILKDIHKARLERVLAVLDSLKIEFPNTEVSRRTGVNEGNVSNYLSGNKPMGNKFYTSFMEKFVPKRPDIIIKSSEVGKEVSRLIGLTINQQAKLNLILRVLKISDAEIEQEISNLHKERTEKQKS